MSGLLEIETNLWDLGFRGSERSYHHQKTRTHVYVTDTDGSWILELKAGARTAGSGWLELEKKLGEIGIVHLH